MKKFILTLILFLGGLVLTFAQRNYNIYQANSYAYATINQYTGKYVWTDWYKCNVKITMDLKEDIIVIYSKEKQIYYVIECEGTSTDSSGGKQVSFKVIDQDEDRGHLRLRIEKNGNSQLYIDFKDVAWVYNVVKLN